MPSIASSARSGMAESFLHLPAAEQSQILRALAPQLDRPAFVLEKDVWVCWVLQHLFTMPGRLPMAFKGGTSLSKVFKAIERFSEDVDITLDYRHLNASTDPLQPGLSGRQLRQISDELKAFVQQHAHEKIGPYFSELLAHPFGAGEGRLELSENGEAVRIHYPSVLEESTGYVSSSVLLELGGRNITEPNALHTIRPDIADYVADLELPVAQATVLVPERTFWEKATLMHVECNRGELRANSARLSRHWYDLARLADMEIGQRALADRALLANVIRHKKIFYNAAYANYDACLARQLRLVPDASGLMALASDYGRMREAGMFIGEPPGFDAIVARLRTLEAETDWPLHQLQRARRETTGCSALRNSFHFGNCCQQPWLGELKNPQECLQKNLHNCLKNLRQKSELPFSLQLLIHPGISAEESANKSADKALVVITQLGDEERLPHHLVNDAVLIIDAPRPVPRQRMLQRLRLADAGKGRPRNLPDERVDALEQFLIGLLPVQVILPGLLGEDQLHSARLRSWPLPSSSSAIASSRRRAFFGLRSR